MNAVVQHRDGRYFTIVDYNQWKTSNRYLAIQTDGLGKWPHGPYLWLDSFDFRPHMGRTSRPPGRIYRKIMAEGGPEVTGCPCGCCVHIKGLEVD